MLPLQVFWNSTDCNATFHLLVFVSGHHNLHSSIMTKVHIILRIATPHFIYWSSSAGIISTGCNARFNLLHRALHNHNESKAERVCLGDGQCRWWRRCSFNTSMTTWPRLGLSALGMTSAAVIRNALDHLKEVADKLQPSATSCHLLRTTKCSPVKLWGSHILFKPWTRNTMDLPPPLHLEAPPLRSMKCCPVKLWGIQSLNKEYYGPSQSTHTFTRPSSMVHSHHHCTWRRLHFEVAHDYWTVYLHGRN